MMRFDGCLKFSEGSFCQKMADSIAIFGSTLPILMLDQFSPRKKMHLEQLHRMWSGAKPSERFLETTVV